jgi:hypothetical protein
MTVEKEREYRACCTSGGTEVDPVFAELDATRAALASAEAKLAAEKASRIGWAESAERWRNHYYETLALLADERLHADALAAGYKAGDGGRCGVCGVREDEHHEYCPAASHAARRAANAPLSDAGASSEVANG